MKRRTRPVTSREYKVMLKAGRFEGGKKEVLSAAEGFQKAFAAVAEEILGNGAGKVLRRGSMETTDESKQVRVEFYDTKDLRLRAADLVFRSRRSGKNGPLELTLKFRHPDRFLASNSNTGGKIKFEEDIKATHSHNFISLYSLSGKIKDVDAKTDFNSLRDIKRFYKSLRKLLGDSYEPSAKLCRVGNLVARQTVLEGPSFRIDKQVRSRCAVIIWHKQGQKSPLVAEFSFRYVDDDLGPRKEPFTAETARRSFGLLQAFRDKRSPLAKWVDLRGPTKTRFVYDLEHMRRSRGEAAK